jgi:hypothetical protein
VTPGPTRRGRGRSGADLLAKEPDVGDGEHHDAAGQQRDQDREGERDGPLDLELDVGGVGAGIDGRDPGTAW